MSNIVEGKEKVKAIAIFIGLKIAEILGVCVVIGLFYFIGRIPNVAMYLFFGMLAILLLGLAYIGLWSWFNLNWRIAKAIVKNGKNWSYFV